MSTSADLRILLIGAGGVGAPAAWALLRAAKAPLTVVDDDRVERSNLHRQILFSAADVGTPKLDALARAACSIAPRSDVRLVAGRALPTTAEGLVKGAAVVVDGTDNFPSRFLLADASLLAGRPVVHAAAVRWHGTVFVSGPSGRPCYRCLFEDLPEGPAPDCATAGVVGPVCGVIGGLAADAALQLLRGDLSLAGTIASFDGKTGRFRRVAVRPRRGCPLCGDGASIHDIEASRYAGPSCETG